MLKHVYFICKTIESNIDTLKSEVTKYNKQIAVISNTLKIKTAKTLEKHQIKQCDLMEFISSADDNNSIELSEKYHKCLKAIFTLEYKFLDRKKLLFNRVIQPHISIHIISSKIDQVVDYINEKK